MTKKLELNNIVETIVKDLPKLIGRNFHKLLKYDLQLQFLKYSNDTHS